MEDEPEEVRQLKELEYFHPDLDRHKAEAILLQNGTDGTFLIRPSSRKKNEFAVSARSANAVKHFNLVWEDDAFHFGHGTYETCDDLAYHFSNKPLLGGESGHTTLLVDPYPRTVTEPNLYEYVRVHAEDTIGESARRKDFSINSKEGYLTKVGSVFKVFQTWKVRWFVLQKNELKYFKNSQVREPLRVLDLNECRECQMEEEGKFKDKEHVFRVVFDWRTFYCFAPSQKESQDWVKLINWRLDQRKKEYSQSL